MKDSALFLCAALMSCFVSQTDALAQGKPAPATQKTPTKGAAAESPRPAIEPAALALLKATSDELAKAKSIAFAANGAFDVPARNGQPLFYTTRSEVLLVRPDKLRVVVPGDGPASEFYYDGNKITVFQPYTDFVATEEVKGTLEEALDAVYKKAGIYLPFVDFIVADPYKTLTDGLTSAFVIGKSKIVGGTETDIIALSNGQVHLQLWIAEKDKLPRLAWVTPANNPKQPRHMIEFSDWRLEGEIAEGETFSPKTKASTKQIPFARPESHGPAKAK